MRISISKLLLLALFPVALAATPLPAPATTASQVLLNIEPTAENPRSSEGDILELKDGSLALVYTRFTGGAADHSAADLALRPSADGGRTWSPDRIFLRNEGGTNVMSVSLHRLPSGEILLFYLRKEGAHNDCHILVRRSEDELATLSKPVLISSHAGYHVMNNARVLQLTTGRLICPAILHNRFDDDETTNPRFSERGVPFVYYSDDDGRTWQRDQTPLLRPADTDPTLQENGLVERSNGSIWMYIRSDQGVQMESESRDGGLTWSKPVRSSLHSPLSPATVRRVPWSGKLLAAWNDHSGAHPFPAGKRTPLCIAVSTDDGKTWGPSAVIEPDPDGWYCYTSITFFRDQALLSYCAGDKEVGGLNRLRVTSLPRAFIDGLKAGGE